MSNQCAVYTKKWLAPDKVTKFLLNLNETIFKSEFELNASEIGKSWILQSTVSALRHVGVSCWLESGRHMEISHGGCGTTYFKMWVDYIIANDLALAFIGTMIEDCDGRRDWPKLNIHRTFESYCLKETEFMLESSGELGRRWMLQNESSFAPPAFQFYKDKPVRLDRSKTIEGEFIEYDNESA